MIGKMIIQKSQTNQDRRKISPRYSKKKLIIYRRVYNQQCFHLVFGVLLSCIFYGFPPQCAVNAYHYHSEQTKISSPEMVCLSGTASTSHLCPSTQEEMKSYPGVVMDEYGYVHIKLMDIQMKVKSADARKLEGEGSEGGDASEDEDSSEDGESSEENNVNSRNKPKGKVETRNSKPAISKTSSSTSQKGASKLNSPDKSVAVNEESTNTHNFFHHLQLFLINLDEGWSPRLKYCCYEYDYPESRPAFVGKNSDLPSECSIIDPKHVRDDENQNSDTSLEKFSHDYRIDVNRFGKDQIVTAPIPLTVELSNGTQPRIILDTKLHPEKFGRYMLVISNCAAEMSLQPNSLTTFTAIIDEMDIRFVSRFGELPLSMMGIIPFYGLMMLLYMILATVWWKRSCPSKKNKTIHLLGLQRAIRKLVFMEALFSAVAFSYYLQLNWTPVELDVLYSGTAAALLNWGPWSMFVATVHFLTIFGCQVVVTLATDGTWLIQNYIREDTRKVLYALGTVWIIFFGLYGFVSPSVRTFMFLGIFLSWVVFLLFNVRRSISHLRSLMIGQSTDNVMAIGGALVAKRSLYRRIYAVVAIYPVIFLLGLYWNFKAQADSWSWVGYVLGDLYLFIILLHASVIWLPRAMSSQEFIKYAPLELSVTANNDLELWEEGVNEDWGEEEIELNQGLKLQ